MSKSLGNALYPSKFAKVGADLLRLWSAPSNTSRRKMSERVMTQLSEAYRKIRIPFASLSQFRRFPSLARCAIERSTEEFDAWMLDRTAELVKKCSEWYANYEFHRVYHAIHDYCVVDLSAFYFDVLKDRLYTRRLE